MRDRYTRRQTVGSLSIKCRRSSQRTIQQAKPSTSVARTPWRLTAMLIGACEFLLMEEGLELGALSLAFAQAAAMGFLVAAPVGPVGALCINRTLGSGAIVGLATGLGAATVHGGWTLVMVLGLTAIEAPDKAGPFTQWATVAGALLLAYIGIRTCMRPSVSIPAAIPLPTALVCLSAYLSGIALTSTNPTTPFLFLTTMPALLPGNAQASLYWPLLAVGTFAGSCCWWVILSGTTASLRHHVTGSVLSNINKVAGAVLIALAALLFSRAF